MKERITFIFENYPLTIVTSNAQRAIKYEFGRTKLLKKFLNKKVFEFKQGNEFVYKDIDGKTLDVYTILNQNYKWVITKKKKELRYFLSDLDDNLIIANPNKAGKQKTKVINGQNLHQLTLTTYDRANILTTLKTYFLNEIKNYILPTEIKLPIHIEYIFYSNQNKIESDLNNHVLFYEKTFSDVIQQNIILNREQGIIKNEYGFIPDDKLENYTSYEIHHCYLPENEKNHYLVVVVYDNVDNKHLLNKLDTYNTLIPLL